MIGRVFKILESVARAEDKAGWVGNKIAWRLFESRLRRQQLVNQAFDRRNGTDTADEIPLVLTGVPPKDAARGNGVYRPVWESEFHAALSALKIDFDGFTFVDVGSGKGKLLMLASDYPFARIIGVEYSPGLHVIAQRNVSRYQSPTQRCKILEPVLGDALHYRVPEGPIVCFIFNALDPATMRKVMQTIEDDVSSRTMPAYVIYANLRRVAEIGDGLDGIKKLQRLSATPKLVLFGNAAAYHQYMDSISAPK